MKTSILKSEYHKDLSESSVHSVIRLINFIVDTVVWLILFFSIAYIFDLYFVRFSSYWLNYVYSISLGLILYFAYYLLLEFYFHRTLGKFLTRTKVVNRDGAEPTFLAILKRTLSRLILIDVFYYLFSKSGLHDRLSATIVIKNHRQPGA